MGYRRPLTVPGYKNICFVDSIDAPLICCICNRERYAIREGFVDKTAAVAQFGGNLAYSQPLDA